MSELATPTDRLTGLGMPTRQDDVIQRTNNEPPKRAHFDSGKVYKMVKPSETIESFDVNDQYGIPLPIIPTETFLRDELRGDLSKHHEWFPGDNPIFETVGGIALRSSRIWKIQKGMHNIGPKALHVRKINPPAVPEDELGQVRACLLSLAGYFPEKGLDLTGDEVKTRVIEKDEREIMATLHFNNGNITNYRYFSAGSYQIRSFLMQIVMRQPLLESRAYVEHAEQFKHARGHVERELGHALIEMTAGAVTSEIEKDYQDARLQNLLKPKAPKTVKEIFINCLGNTKTRETLFPILKDRIAAALGESACNNNVLVAA